LSSPSLDEVFFALTGRAAPVGSDSHAPEDASS